MRTGGPPGTWEILSSPCEKNREETGLPTPGPVAGRAQQATGAEHMSAPRYRRAKEDEVRRDGRQEVGAPHSTDEAGEPAYGDPVEGRGSRVTEP